MQNKHAKWSRISESKLCEVLRHCVADLIVFQAVQLSGLNCNTVNRLYRGLREGIFLACEAPRPFFCG